MGERRGGVGGDQFSSMEQLLQACSTGGDHFDPVCQLCIRTKTIRINFPREKSYSDQE